MHIAESKDPMRLAEHVLRLNWTDSKHRLRIRRWREGFYVWTSETGAYTRIDYDSLSAELYKVLDETVCRTIGTDGEPTAKPVRPSSRTINEVTKAMVTGTLVSGDAPQWLSGNRFSASNFLPLKNGLLNVETREFLEPTPEFFTTAASPVAYKPNTPKPKRWEQFLGELWEDDQQCKDTLAEWMGYCLTTDTSQQKILLVPGPKRAGKGTIIRALSSLVGPNNVCSPTLSSLGTDFGPSQLLNKTVATITDARLGGRIDQAQIIEQLLAISGEDSQTVNRKYMTAINTRLRVRFVVVTNELPKLRDSSGALASRFLILPLTRSFYGKEDRGLEAALTSELPGILNWALDGLDRLRARGSFVQPDSAAEAVQELEDLASPVAAFVREVCEEAPHAQVAVKVLFREWSHWAEDNGMYCGDSSTFGRNLRAVVPSLRTAQPRNKGGRERVFRGIGIASSVDA